MVKKRNLLYYHITFEQKNQENIPNRYLNFAYFLHRKVQITITVTKRKEVQHGNQEKHNSETFRGEEILFRFP